MSSRDTAIIGTSRVGGTEAHVSRSLWALLLPILGVVALAALIPIWFGDSRVNMGVAVIGVSFGCYAIAFNLIFGSTGQLFLCVGALAGIGGYGGAIFADKVGLPIVASIILAALLSGITSGLLSFVAVRRSLGVIFTGIITLIFTLVYENMLLGLGSLTGGENGFLIVAGRDSFIRRQIPPYYVMLVVLFICLVVHGLLRRSHIGWAFRALRDDEVAAELTGVNVAKYRVYAAAIGGAMLGLTGATYAFTEGRISPTTYGFAQVDVVVLVMLAFGGIGTLFGPVLGSAVFTVVEELFIDLGRLRVMAYGFVIIVLFLWIPNGLIPAVRSAFRSRGSGRRGARGDPAPAAEPAGSESGG